MDFEIPENLRMMRETIRRFVNQDLESISQLNDFIGIFCSTEYTKVPEKSSVW